MNRFLLALQFLTILPFKIRGKIKDEDLGRSLLYFPVVGLLLGLFLSCVAYISASLPPL
ncbi:MAG: adenosylcobinamide-GDP ribazoletransferase, partial [Candidatus Omnitrophica bacterium]|nr:adenosylcobinamide-GDP ribazoletransferase [Candidatus Omnitrophota bacterium]